MADDFGSSDAADTGAIRQRATLDHSGHETPGKHVTGTSRIHQLFDLFAGNDMAIAAFQHDRPCRRPGNDRDAGVFCQFRHCFIKALRLVERADFMFIAEHQVDMASEQLLKIGAMAFDAEHVRKREGDLAIVGAGHGYGLLHRGARCRRVPQIAFEIQDLRRGNAGIIKIGFGQFLASTKIGVHGAIAIGRDDNQAAAGRGPAGRWCGGKINPGSANIMGKNAA